MKVLVMLGHPTNEESFVGKIWKDDGSLECAELFNKQTKELSQGRECYFVVDSYDVNESVIERIEND